MIVIFEGPDKAGKSTIVKGVAQAYNAPVFKFSHPKSRYELRKSVDDLYKGTKYDTSVIDLIIFDRWNVPSDLVYSPIVDNVPSSLVPYVADIQHVMIKKGAVFIYVTASLQTLTERYKQVGDEYINIDMLQAVYEGYEDFFAFTTVPFRRIDTTNLTPEEAISGACDIIQHLQQIVKYKKL